MKTIPLQKGAWMLVALLFLSLTGVQGQFIYPPVPQNPCPGTQFRVCVSSQSANAPVSAIMSTWQAPRDTFPAIIDSITSCRPGVCSSGTCSSIDHVLYIQVPDSIPLGQTVRLTLYDSNGSTAGARNIVIQYDNPGFSYPNLLPGDLACNQWTTLQAQPNSINGTFSTVFAPTGVNLDTSNGTLTLNQGIGPVRVAHTTRNCGITTHQDLELVPPLSAAFSYNNGSMLICRNNSGQQIVFPDNNPLSPGQEVYSCTSAGLSIDDTLGFIDVNNSQPGLYQITHTVYDACTSQVTQTLIIDGPGGAFSYPDSVICLNGGRIPIPTLAPNVNGGGTFSAAPSGGISINPNNGVIDLNGSNPGSYRITYTPPITSFCTDPHTVRVTLVNGPPVQLSYPSTQFCSGDTSWIYPDTFISLDSSGIFIGLNGLQVDSVTGAFRPSGSGPNLNYGVRYLPGDTCEIPAQFNLAIIPTNSADIHYDADTICQTAPIQTVRRTGVPGGTYTSSDPLNCWVNPNTGDINPASCTAGSTFIITYNTPGNCAVPARDTLTFIAEDTLTFSYASDSFCPGPVVLPTPSNSLVTGTFSSSAGLVIDSTGVVNTAASASGSFIIDFIPSTFCWAGGSTSLVINPLSNANFTYGDSVFCQDQPNPQPYTQGQSAGSYSCLNPDLVWEDTTLGKIDLAASQPDSLPYLIRYITNTICTDTAYDQVYIVPRANATITLPDSLMWQNEICQTHDFLVPAVEPGGLFSSDSAGLVFDSLTGIVDLQATPPGYYSLTYTLSGLFGRCEDQHTVNFRMVAPDVFSFSYDTPHLCIGGANGTPAITPDTLLGQPGIFSWTGLSGGDLRFRNTVNGNQSYNGIILSDSSDPGSYIVGFSHLQRACPVDTSLELAVHPPDLATFTFRDSVFCTTDPQLIAENVSWPGGDWDLGAGLARVPGTSQLIIDLASSTEGTKFITYSVDSLCPNSHTEEITLLKTPDTQIQVLDPLNLPGTQVIICAGDYLHLGTRYGEASYVYTWVLVGDSLPPSEIPDYDREYLSSALPPGLHRIVVTEQTTNGCTDSAMVKVRVNPRPLVAWGTFTATIVDGDVPGLTIESNLDSTDFYWEIIDSNGTRFNRNQGWVFSNESGRGAITDLEVFLLKGNTPGTFIIEVTPFAVGCESPPFQAEIKVIPGNQDPYFSQLISPNGDGYNDEFIFYSREPGTLETHSIELFNRLGAQVMPPTFLNDTTALRLTTDRLPDGIYSAVIYDELDQPVWKGGIRIKRSNY